MIAANKIVKTPSACKLTTFKAKPLQPEVGTRTVFDFEFSGAEAADGNSIRIIFPTNNGQRNTFETNLGISELPARDTSGLIDCVLYDLTNTTHVIATCTLTKAASQGVGNPVNVVVSGHGALVAANSYRLTIPGILNPPNVNTAVNSKIMHIRITIQIFDELGNFDLMIYQHTDEDVYFRSAPATTDNLVSVTTATNGVYTSNITVTGTVYTNPANTMNLAFTGSALSALSSGEFVINLP